MSSTVLSLFSERTAVLNAPLSDSEASYALGTSAVRRLGRRFLRFWTKRKLIAATKSAPATKQATAIPPTVPAGTPFVDEEECDGVLDARLRTEDAVWLLNLGCEEVVTDTDN